MSFVLLFLTFAKIGLLAFGGGSATLPLIEREIVMGHQWLSHNDFVELIAIAEITPGPIAVNTATFVGYKLGGIWGSVVATLAVALPSASLLLIVLYLIRKFSKNTILNKIVSGLRPAVIALIATAVYSIAGKGIADLWGIAIAVVCFLVLRTHKVSPIFVLITAGVSGMLIYL